MSKDGSEKWVFFSDESDDPKNLRREKLQTASDIYKAMQARMDGYRQSAGALFIGVIASVLAFDSAFVRLLVDPSFWSSGNQKPDHYLAGVIIACGLLLVLVAGLGSLMIHWLGQYFAEMTSIIYKMDLANQVFAPGAWLPGKPLYPRNFISDNRVGRCPADQDLIGWRDPAISWFRNISLGIMITHLVLYGFLARLAQTAASELSQVTDAPASTNSVPNVAPSPFPNPTPSEAETTHD